MNRPWMKFYPSDWRSDPALRMCSLAARGLWMEMLGIMHEAEPYGHLVVKGVAVEPDALAKMVGIGVKECRNLLATLRQVGVFSETEAGIIYSRRMVRDHAKALKDKENGKRGGNPALGAGVNPQDKAHKPEARDQKEALVEPTEIHPEKPDSDIGAAAPRTARGGKAYAFESGVIRLTEADFRKFEQAFPNIRPDLQSELMGLAGWAGEQPNWFFAVQGALAKRNRDARLAIERVRVEAHAAANAPPKPKIAYLGP